ncbi:hypothetical protein ABPG75_013208 [Micractinium tetrahymenae]
MLSLQLICLVVGLPGRLALPHFSMQRPGMATPEPIPTLVRRLQGGGRAVQAAAVEQLAQLSAAHGQALVEAGAIPALVRLLRKGSRAEAEQAALILLGNLALVGASAAQAAAAALPLVLARLRSSNLGLASAAAGAVGNIVTAGVEAQQAARAAGAVAAVLQALRHGGAASTDLQENFSLALKNLLIFDGAVQPAELSSAVAAAPAAVALLRSSNVATQHHAAYAVANLVLAGTEAQAVAAAAGAIPALLYLADQSRDQLVRRAASTALGHLADNKQIAASILAEPGGKAFLEVLQIMGDALMKAVATSALALAEAGPPAASVTPVDEQPAQSSQAASGSTFVHASTQAGTADTAGPPPRRTRICAAPGCSTTSGLRSCRGCRGLRYCSAACQVAHWPEHRPECLRLRAEAAARGQASGGAVP